MENTSREEKYNSLVQQVIGSATGDRTAEFGRSLSTQEIKLFDLGNPKNHYRRKASILTRFLRGI